MADFEKLQAVLTAEGFAVSCFQTAAEAADYLDRVIDGQSVGLGGSVTLREMGLPQRLALHNQVADPWQGADLREACAAQVYLASLNGVAETGELVNIDGTGNRVAAGLFGPKKLYFVVGRNKIAPDYAGAVWRARNIAGPKNAQRLQKKTPCAVKGDRCYNCSSPERICAAMVTYWRRPRSMEVEIVLIDQDLGY